MKRALLLTFSCFCLLFTLAAQKGDCGDCKDVDKFTEKGVVVAKEIKKAELTIFPNPTTDFIGLKNTDKNTIAKIAIYNLVGRKMKSFPVVAGKKYYIADLPEGLYLVQMIGTDSKVIRTQRMTKR